MNTAQIIPAILAKSTEELNRGLAAVSAFALKVHIDIADGIFVPNTTILGVKELADYAGNLVLSAHLMVSRPENHIVRWVEVPLESIIFHIESTEKPQEVIDLIKEGERLAGISLNPETDIKSLGAVIDQIDFIHFMSVTPGRQGSAFVDGVVSKIADFHFYYPDMPISADGGITPANAKTLVKAGADTLIVGSYILRSSDQSHAYQEIIDATK